jgi:hypothetical protein
MITKSLHLAGCAAALGAFAVSMASAGTAHAADCSTLNRPVVIGGSSAVASFVQVVAQALAAEDNPITIVYTKPGSCAGLASIIPVGPVLFTGNGTTWDSTGTASTCTFNNTPTDIGISDVFPATCGFTVPSGMKEYRGPIQSMTFAVYKDSNYHVMSGEAGYLTLGLGNNSTTPWNDITHIWVRDQFSGTQQMIATAVGVPATSFQSAGCGGTGNPFVSCSAAQIISGLQATAGDQDVIDASVGILGMDAIRGNAAGDVIPLAYQHFGQTAGYYPSSSLGSNDMQNTRDGHYMIQGPVHMVTRVSGGSPVNPDAKILIDYLTGATIPTSFDLISLEAGKSIVPDCAMRVKRDEEIGPFMSYMPPASCECKFLFETTQSVPDECGTGCTSNGDCTSARPQCNYGYCEVQ